jgi:O-antigen/teichoic acid export membrane protein
VRAILERLGFDSFTLNSFSGLLASSFLIFGFGRALYLAMHALMGRYLGPEAYGQVNFALVNVQFLILVADFGLSLAGVRFIAGYLERQEWGQLKDYVQFSGRVVTLSGLTLAVTGGVTLWLLPMSENQAQILLLTALLIAPMAFSWWRDCTSRGFHRPREALLPREVLYPVFAIASIWIFSLWDVLGVGLSLVGAVGAAEIIGLWLLYRAVPASFKAAARGLESRKPWFRVSLPIMFHQLARTSIDRADLVAVGLFMDLYTLGLYAAATRIGALMTFMSRILTPVMGPMLARAFSKREQTEIRRLLVRSIILTLLANIPILGLFVVLPELVLSLLGEKFSQGAVYLRILALGYFVSMLFAQAANTLLMTGQERIQLSITTISAVANVAGLVVFVPLYGATGAAAVTATALMMMSLANFLRAFYAPRATGTRPHERL